MSGGGTEKSLEPMPPHALRDYALLADGERGAVVGPDDPRTIETLRAYMAELTQDGYAYRFRHDQRPLEQAEGAFLLYGFLMALALQQAGLRGGRRPLVSSVIGPRAGLPGCIARNDPVGPNARCEATSRRRLYTR